ncbi:hypothetical protein HOO54_15600 [Bacillus sp. WMMC1349]|uniref:hypothetical protein n=1 Tax=Bacillus sp. WMMC1349 TaxID=2736254 RepID=UPI0015551885|nr:hypothetical protein [Bacillus sp. WMMC1349]NPC93618.1 hypothetical protein [Bacillus sp. WMMC1349]
MRIWYEKQKDIFNYFKWFKKEKIKETQKIAVFSMNASQLLEDEHAKETFLKQCTTGIRKIFHDIDLKKYNFYFFINIEIENENSRIEKYKKVWKLIDCKWNTTYLNKGPEVEIDLDGVSFYSSLAQFKIEHLDIVLKIIDQFPNRSLIFATEKENIMEEQKISQLFEITFKNKNNTFDLENLVSQLCKDGDILFRWGAVLDEVELAMIFSHDNEKLFKIIFSQD